MLFELGVPEESASDEEKAQYKLQFAKVSALLKELEDRGVSSEKLKPYHDVTVYSLNVSILQGEERKAKLDSEICLTRCERQLKIMVGFDATSVEGLSSYKKCREACDTASHLKTEELIKQRSLLNDERRRLDDVKLEAEKTQKSNVRQNKKNPPKSTSP